MSAPYEPPGLWPSGLAAPNGLAETRDSIPRHVAVSLAGHSEPGTLTGAPSVARAYVPSWVQLTFSACLIRGAWARLIA